MFAKLFGSLLGRHFIHISNPGHLVGTFNAHLRDAVVLFADEAFYAGDKKHVSILKTLITEETIQIEAKGIDAETHSNYVHLIMASNDAHVIPAGGDERRFCVLDVGRNHQMDSDYFRALIRQMDEGGREALLHHLLTYDLSGFNLFEVPQTQALQEQKELSFSPEEDWWYNKLLEGRLMTNGDNWPEEVAKEEVLEDFIEYTERFRISRRGNATALGKFLSRVCPGIVSRQKKGAFNRYNHKSGYTEIVERRGYFYTMPTLKASRSVWNDLYGKVDWPEEQPVQESLPVEQAF